MTPSFTLPLQGRVGVGAPLPALAQRPHPNLPPAGEGARP
jgi:hypothetical protein